MQRGWQWQLLQCCFETTSAVLGTVLAALHHTVLFQPPCVVRWAGLRNVSGYRDRRHVILLACHVTAIFVSLNNAQYAN